GPAGRDRDRRHVREHRPRPADARRDGPGGDADRRTCSGRVLPGQQDRMSEMESLRGQLLVASPGLLDPNFRRTVVLVTEHIDEGAAGLVLNRPSDAPVADLVPQLEALVDGEEQVWVGGPVQTNAVLVLGEFVDPDDAAVPLFGSLGFPSLDDPDDVATQTTRRRVFAGYSGWGAGQLEDAPSRDDWSGEGMSPGYAVTDPPD